MGREIVFSVSDKVMGIVQKRIGELAREELINMDFDDYCYDFSVDIVAYLRKKGSDEFVCGFRGCTARPNNYFKVEKGSR